MLLPLLLNNLLSVSNRVWKNGWRVRRDRNLAAADKVSTRAFTPPESDIIPAQIEAVIEPETPQLIAVEVIRELIPEIAPITLEAMQRAVEESIAGMVGAEIARPLVRAQEIEAVRLGKIRRNNQLAIMFIMASI